jgi:hypothetical protein
MRFKGRGMCPHQFFKKKVCVLGFTLLPVYPGARLSYIISLLLGITAGVNEERERADDTKDH